MQAFRPLTMRALLIASAGESRLCVCDALTSSTTFTIAFEHCAGKLLDQAFLIASKASWQPPSKSIYVCFQKQNLGMFSTGKVLICFTFNIVVDRYIASATCFFTAWFLLLLLLLTA